MLEKLKGTPIELGFVRKPEFDHLCSRQEAWLSPQGVALALPPKCKRLVLKELNGTRGVTLVVIEPDGVYSFWPRRKAEG